MINEHDIKYDQVKDEINSLTGETKMYYNLIIDIIELYKEVKSPGNRMTCDVLLIRYRNCIIDKISDNLKKYLSYCNKNLVD